MSQVSLTEIIKRLDLKNYTPEIATDDIMVTKSDINRAALQLTGFFEHFESERVQVIGYVEYTYIEKQRDEKKLQAIIDKLMSYKVPCLIFCRDLEPPEEFF